MVRSMNVAWWVERWAGLHPDKVAVIFEKERISYAELDARASRTACWFQGQGIEKGDRVAVLLHNCPEFLELYLACARMGAIFVPLNFRLAPPELDYILKNCRPRLFVYGTDLLPTVTPIDVSEYRPPLVTAKVGPGPGLADSVNYQTDTAAFCDHKPFLTALLGPADPEEPQVIMYTSGTTGNPKGAVLSHRKTFFNCLNAEIFFSLSFDDVMLITLPMFHSGGLFIMGTPCLYKGATQLIHAKFDPLSTYQDMETYRVTKFLGVPTLFRALIKVDPTSRGDLSSLKVCAVGGEKVTPEFIAECARSGFRLRQIMGQTETSILLWASEDETRKRPGTVGRPVFHAEVRLVDAGGAPIAHGQVGELTARGSILMKEYFRDPDKTEDTIRGNWLFTGDLARQDEDGYFYLVDRARDMYITGGENVYPAEIEKVLEEDPRVEEVAVVGVPDETWGEAGWAFVILKQGTTVTQEDLLGICRARLARYKLPKKIVFCDDFPRTPLGKARKFLLREQILSDLDTFG